MKYISDSNKAAKIDHAKCGACNPNKSWKIVNNTWLEKVRVL